MNSCNRPAQRWISAENVIQRVCSKPRWSENHQITGEPLYLILTNDLAAPTQKLQWQAPRVVLRNMGNAIRD